MNICIKVSEISTRFEKQNTQLKKDYLIKNILTINKIMENVPGYFGSFGTGYPFYALNPNLEGTLPIIEEQINYNNQLSDLSLNYSNWACESCLNINGLSMPDLKQFCKPCPNVEDSLKPRKVINRLPDIDMWMICADDKVGEAKNKLCHLFSGFNMRTSDVDPIGAINDIEEIVNDLELGKMPEKYLPLDVHIIEYSKISNLLDAVPITIINSTEKNILPYLPIHPISLRKTWQYDDVAYNFILDYLFSLTPFNWEENLNNKLKISREFLSMKLTENDFVEILNLIAPESVKRRLQTNNLQKSYEKRIGLWKK